MRNLLGLVLMVIIYTLGSLFLIFAVHPYYLLMNAATRLNRRIDWGEVNLVMSKRYWKRAWVFAILILGMATFLVGRTGVTLPSLFDQANTPFFVLVGLAVGAIAAVPAIALELLEELLN